MITPTHFQRSQGIRSEHVILDRTTVPPGIGCAPTQMESLLMQSCCHSVWEGVKGIPRRIVDFAYNRYADVRLFFRALSSVFSSQWEGGYDERIARLERFGALAANPRASMDAVHIQYGELPDEIKYLLFYTAPAIFQQNRREEERTRAAIQRDCAVAALFQKLLIPFSYVLMSHNAPTGRPSRSMPPIQSVPAPVLRPRPEISIPGTVPYIQGGIPEEVQERAHEIERLEEKLCLENIVIPEGMEDTLICNFMKIPVFDSSHPENVRHPYDYTSIDRIIKDRSPSCPACRHPYNREALDIDVDLQKRILEHLKNLG
ncbi:MAG: hypothetical protein JSS61_01780 [Verrucomicrobia bacterium]|nr:hypothetical protein [Verrucomicrobiota bacterium]